MLLKKNQAFRAVRHALFKYKAYVTGLLTDTNSLVANLAPQLEHDPSVCIFGNPQFVTYDESVTEK